MICCFFLGRDFTLSIADCDEIALRLSATLQAVNSFRHHYATDLASHRLSLSFDFTEA